MQKRQASNAQVPHVAREWLRNVRVCDEIAKKDTRAQAETVRVRACDGTANKKG